MKLCAVCGGQQPTELGEIVPGERCFCWKPIVATGVPCVLPGFIQRQWSESDIRRIVREELAAKRDGG